MLKYRPRGQVLPIWGIGALTVLILAFFGLNYANVVRWQVRAQNAADAAAQAMVAVQTTQWNQMNVALYSAAVEEYRIRNILYQLTLSVQQQGGCAAAGSCATDYANLRTAYLQAVNRYTKDVKTLDQITATSTFANQQADAVALLAYMQDRAHCGTARGLDCRFKYKLVKFESRTDMMEAWQDAYGIVEPGYVDQSLIPVDPPATVNKAIFGPARAEIVVCAKADPLIKPFFPQGAAKPFHAIARAAATAVMGEEDWMQPGSINKPASLGGGPFQPTEHYATPVSDNGWDWNAISFTGNAAQTYVQYNAYGEYIASNEFSAQFGWWSSVPVKPTYGALQPNDIADLDCAP